MGSSSPWGGRDSISLNIAPMGQVTTTEAYHQQTINPSICWRRAIFGIVIVTTSHSSCWTRQKSRMRGRVTCSLSHLFWSKHCSLSCRALHRPPNLFQSPTLILWCLCIQPWILWYLYIFWWNKPLNVNWPVQVLRKSEPMETQPQVIEPISAAQELTWKAIDNGLKTALLFIAGVQDDGVKLTCRDSVPMFWANSINSNTTLADLIMIGEGVCFGMIHCTPTWSLSFLTHVELGLLMWQISSFAITQVSRQLATCNDWALDNHIQSQTGNTTVK